MLFFKNAKLNKKEGKLYFKKKAKSKVFFSFIVFLGKILIKCILKKLLEKK